MPVINFNGKEYVRTTSTEPIVWGKSNTQQLLSSGKQFADVQPLMGNKGVDTCDKTAPFNMFPLCYSGYKAVTSNPPVHLANFILLDVATNNSFGDHFFVTYNGKEYLIRVEYHCHRPKEAGPKGFHRGITVYSK